MLDGQITVDSALTMAITTAGFNLNGPCYQQYQFCLKVLEDTIKKEVPRYNKNFLTPAFINSMPFSFCKRINTPAAMINKTVPKKALLAGKTGDNTIIAEETNAIKQIVFTKRIS